MPRNKSEKLPWVMAERQVKPAALQRVWLILKADGNRAYSVWIGSGISFYAMDASDEREARQVYDWFSDDFYYHDMPAWGAGRWKTKVHAT